MTWPIKKLEEVCTVVTDGVHKTPNYINDGIRFISIKNIAPFAPLKWNNYVRFISDENHAEFSKKAKVEKGDILFPRIGTLGFAKRVDFDEPVSIFVGLGLAKPKHNIIDSRFLELWMNTPFVYEYSHEKASGSGRLTLALRDSRKMPVPFPPLEMQKKIVAKLEKLLAKVKEAKKLRAEAQEATNQLLSAELHKIFEEGIKKYGLVKVGDICDIKGGKRLPRGHRLQNEKTNHPYIRVADFIPYGIAINKIKFVDEDAFSQIKRYTISKDDVFISIAGTIGATGIIPINLDGANLTENAAKLTNLKNIEQKYLMYLLTSNQVQSQIQGDLIQTTISKFGLFRIAKLEIPLPPLTEQKKIVVRLDALSAKIRALQEYQQQTADDLESLEQSILHQAFKEEP